MIFRETRETEEDIRRMFCEAREKMKNMIDILHIYMFLAFIFCTF